MNTEPKKPFTELTVNYDSEDRWITVDPVQRESAHVAAYALMKPEIQFIEAEGELWDGFEIGVCYSAGFHVLVRLTSSHGYSTDWMPQFEAVEEYNLIHYPYGEWVKKELCNVVQLPVAELVEAIRRIHPDPELTGIVYLTGVDLPKI